MRHIQPDGPTGIVAGPYKGPHLRRLAVSVRGEIQVTQKILIAPPSRRAMKMQSRSGLHENS